MFCFLAALCWIFVAFLLFMKIRHGSEMVRDRAIKLKREIESLIFCLRGVHEGVGLHYLKLFILVLGRY